MTSRQSPRQNEWGELTWSSRVCMEVENRETTSHTGGQIGCMGLGMLWEFLVVPHIVPVQSSG